MRWRDAEEANFFNHWENIWAEQLASAHHHHQGNAGCETRVWVWLAECSGTVTKLGWGGKLYRVYRVSRPSIITSGRGKIMLVERALCPLLCRSVGLLLCRAVCCLIKFGNYKIIPFTKLNICTLARGSIELPEIFPGKVRYQKGKY